MKTDYKGQSFAGQDLRGRDFSGQDLTGCDFSHADLGGAAFDGSDLNSVNFSRADLTGASMTDVQNLSKVNFKASTVAAVGAVSMADYDASEGLHWKQFGPDPTVTGSNPTWQECWDVFNRSLVKFSEVAVENTKAGRMNRWL